MKPCYRHHWLCLFYLSVSILFVSYNEHECSEPSHWCLTAPVERHPLRRKPGIPYPPLDPEPPSKTHCVLCFCVFDPSGTVCVLCFSRRRITAKTQVRVEGAPEPHGGVTIFSAERKRSFPHATLMDEEYVVTFLSPTTHRHSDPHTQRAVEPVGRLVSPALGWPQRHDASNSRRIGEDRLR